MNILASKRVLFAGILLFGLLAMTARTATDPDLWWHLRTGQWIVVTGHVPRTDPFSFTRGGCPWISHEWLSELIFYRLYVLGGPAALIVFSSIVTTIGFMLLYLRCPAQPHWAAAATVLGAFAAAPCWGARPQMFTFTLASLLLWLIERAQGRLRLLFWIPPLFLLWLNLHAGFALGPALLFLCAAGLLLEAILGATPWNEVRPLVLGLLATILVCLALVPLNPSGVQLYRYPLDTVRSPGMRSFIVEWFSPDFHQWLYFPLLLTFLVLLTALALSGHKVKGRDLLPLLFTAFAALDAVRHIPIFVLIAVPVIAATLPRASDFLPSKPPRPPRRPVFALALLLLAAFTTVRWVSLTRHQNAQEAAQFPQDAVAFLAADQQPARLFAHYDWGGYAIWKLYPKYRVFVDGRADLYGDDLLHQFAAATQLHQDWQDILSRWQVGTVLVPPNSALAQALLLDPQWRVSFRGDHAIVLSRLAPYSGSGPVAERDLFDAAPTMKKIFTRASLNLRN